MPGRGKSGVIAGNNAADCCCRGGTVVSRGVVGWGAVAELVASDIFPEGMWSDRDIEEVEDD